MRDAILRGSLRIETEGRGLLDSGRERAQTFMAKVFTIPSPPQIGRRRRERTADPRYVDGQRLLVEAMRYLAQADPVNNRGAIELLSEHVRTRFRMTDSPLA